MKNFCWQTISILMILAVWEGAVELHFFSPLLLPSPLAVLVSFYDIFAEERMAGDLFYTLYRLLAGLVSGSGGGLLFGLLVGSSKALTRRLTFWLDFLRSMPVSALIPLFLLFFGLGDLPKILMVVFVSFLIIAVNTIYGVQNANRVRIMSGVSMGLSRAQIFYRIILPEALPHLATGIRHAISYSLIIVIISEMFIGAQTGLGKRINDFHLTYEIPEMYATIILAGIVGYVFNKIYLIFETKIIHWTGK